jgi:hypothetical protein
MVLHWTAAGMINAERSFRRIKGYKQMPQLVAALHRHAHPDAAPTETVGAAAQSSLGSSPKFHETRDTVLTSLSSFCVCDHQTVSCCGGSRSGSCRTRAPRACFNR